jgi:hypothetical protein
MKALRLSAASVFLLLSCDPHPAPPFPRPGGSINMSISSISLADDCGAPEASARFAAGDCAPPQDGFGCGLCQQSTLQLSIASTASGPARMEIRAIRLYDQATGVPLGALFSREPQVFAPNGYLPWDQNIGAGATLQVSYKLSAPNWTQLGGGDPYRTYNMTFTVEVDVAVEGEVRTLHGTAHRAPEIVT